MTPRAARRFVIFRGKQPVAGVDQLSEVVAFLWGRDQADGYLVLDDERWVDVDNPNLTEWARRHWPQEMSHAATCYPLE